MEIGGLSVSLSGHQGATGQQIQFVVEQAIFLCPSQAADKLREFRGL
jgi:hypothetical protein